MDNVEHFDSTGDKVSNLGDYYVDLYHFARLIKTFINDSEIQNDAQNIMDAITNAVIANYSGYEHSNSQGISIYLSDPRYNEMHKIYETEVVFSRDTDEFLSTYNDLQPPETTITDGQSKWAL